MRSWGRIAGVVGAVSIDDVGAPELAMNCPWFRFNRCHDRASIVILVLKRSSSESVGRIILDSTLKEPRSWLDRITIVVRSCHDRGFLPRVFFVVQWKFDAPCVSVKRRKSASPWLSDHDRAVFMLMKIDVTRVATWRQVSLSIGWLKSSNWARARDGDRVDSVSTASTRFTRCSLDPASAEPPRVTAPNILLGPTNPWTLHMLTPPPPVPRGAPHGRPRGPVDTRGLLPRVRALCAACTLRGPPAALPRCHSATSHPCSGPTCHVSFPVE